jgi:methylated-DNA-protein-cysteine methyltransferase-like protein
LDLKKLLVRKKSSKNFFDKVYEIARQIPRGRVTTYSAIAKHLGVPNGARAVGWAMRACSNPRIPCHRVIRQDGFISGDLFGSRTYELISEGIEVIDSRVDLAKYYYDSFGNNAHRKNGSTGRVKRRNANIMKDIRH